MSDEKKAPALNDSILSTIKKMLGLDLAYDAFDTDIIVLLNSAFMKLQQIGVGPKEGFALTGGLDQMWSDFLPPDTMLEGVKTYLYISVKMVFDPPSNSYIMDALKTEKEELEWRLREQAEFYPGDGTRKGYYEEMPEAETSPEYDASNGSLTSSYSEGNFRAHGGRYVSDPDFPWTDGPSQPALVEPDGDE